MTSTDTRQDEATRRAELRELMNDATRRLNALRRTSPHRDTDDALHRAEAALDRAQTSGYAGSGLTGALLGLLEITSGPRFDFSSPECKAYEQAEHALIDEYNGYVHEYNALQQARRNRRHAAATHAAACNRCFTVHAGECI